jgi:hypothetical protein
MEDLMREKLKALQAEVDGILRAMASTKAEWRDAIDEIDEHHRCEECNSIIGRHQFAALLRLSGVLSEPSQSASGKWRMPTCCKLKVALRSVGAVPKSRERPFLR